MCVYVCMYFVLDYKLKTNKSYGFFSYIINRFRASGMNGRYIYVLAVRFYLFPLSLLSMYWRTGLQKCVLLALIKGRQPENKTTE